MSGTGLLTTLAVYGYRWLENRCDPKLDDMCWQRLPEDIHCHLMGYLSDADLATTSRVSKTYQTYTAAHLKERKEGWRIRQSLHMLTNSQTQPSLWIRLWLPYLCVISTYAPILVSILTAVWASSVWYTFVSRLLLLILYVRCIDRLQPDTVLIGLGYLVVDMFPNIHIPLVQPSRVHLIQVLTVAPMLAGVLWKATKEGKRSWSWLQQHALNATQVLMAFVYVLSEPSSGTRVPIQTTLLLQYNVLVASLLLSSMKSTLPLLSDSKMYQHITQLCGRFAEQILPSNTIIRVGGLLSCVWVHNSVFLLHPLTILALQIVISIYATARNVSSGKGEPVSFWQLAVINQQIAIFI